MVNTQLLDEKLKDSGLKTEFIIKNLGISKQSFYKKKRNEIKFRTAEVYVIASLLKMSDAEKTEIFFADKVD